jgi:hypothetical protein
MNAISAGHVVPTHGRDRRKSQRKREFAPGLLAYGSEANALNCLIRDIGTDGAQIRVSATQPIPDEVYLLSLRNRSLYHARPIWRRGSLTGLSFEKEYVINNLLPVHLEFLRSLLIEAKLRQVDQLTAQGTGITEALSKCGITAANYLQWRDAKRAACGMSLLGQT